MKKWSLNPYRLQSSFNEEQKGFGKGCWSPEISMRMVIEKYRQKERRKFILHSWILRKRRTID